jgi:hypothetical protein
VPNQLNDMHDGSIAQGDAWVSNNLSAYYQWAQTHNSLLIVTFDEDDSSASNQIFTLFVGPMVAAGQYSNRINHFNVLRTIEDMYGLTHAGAAASATPITVGWTTSVPGATTLTAQPGAGHVSLSWTAVTGAERYGVYRGNASNAETLFATVTGQTTYDDTSVTNGTTYFYKVAASNANGDGPLSNEVSATPTATVAAPTNVTATAGLQRITLSWVNNATAATSIAIESRSNPNKPFVQIATVPPSTTSYVNTGLRKRTTYSYRLRTFNGTQASPYSSIASATTP